MLLLGGFGGARGCRSFVLGELAVGSEWEVQN